MRQTEFLSFVLKANIPAIQLISCLGAISQTWDDLIDKDKPTTDEDIHKLMWNALVYLPENPFYRTHFLDLHPTIRNIIVDYKVSTEFESGNKTEQSIAYTLRDNMCQLIIQCAYIIGGYAWMNEIAPTVRRYVHNEDIDIYLKETA